MEWLQLTTEDNRPILISADKILHIRPHPRGSKITFGIALPSKEGKLTFQSVVVSEAVAHISKLVKAKV